MFDTLVGLFVACSILFLGSMCCWLYSELRKEERKSLEKSDHLKNYERELESEREYTRELEVENEKLTSERDAVRRQQSIDGDSLDVTVPQDVAVSLSSVEHSDLISRLEFYVMRNLPDHVMSYEYDIVKRHYMIDIYPRDRVML